MEKELIWVEKSLAETYKELDTDIKRAEFVNELIKQKKVDITSDIQNLDDDLLRFKAFALNYSTALKEAYDKQAERLERLWEECSEPIEKIDKQTMGIKKDIYDITKDIKDISRELEGLNTYKLERIVELINTYNNMSESDKDVFKLILNSR